MPRSCGASLLTPRGACPPGKVTLLQAELELEVTKERAWREQGGRPQPLAPPGCGRAREAQLFVKVPSRKALESHFFPEGSAPGPSLKVTGWAGSGGPFLQYMGVLQRQRTG